MNGQLRIDEMFAFIALDKDGSEGVIAWGGLPLVGADMARVDFSGSPYGERSSAQTPLDTGTTTRSPGSSRRPNSKK